MVLFPNLTQLDLTGPYEVFARTPNTEVRLLAATLEPVRSQHGLAIVPDERFEDAPPLDVVCVPGGPGVDRAMEDREILEFLGRQGDQAGYVTSVCTGALVLGAAGLLQGYRATTHWLSMDLLEMFGAEPLWERVVKDRNRVTGGGVTAGVDFGLAIAAELRGEAVAQEIQLAIEYDPEPPFHSGSPKTADAHLVESVRAARGRSEEERLEVAKRASARLGLG
jgi:cyclohexyl-isocyanide hydratase